MEEQIITGSILIYIGAFFAFGWEVAHRRASRMSRLCLSEKPAAAEGLVDMKREGKSK